MSYGNLYHLGSDLFRFQVWNLNHADLSGHLTFWWHHVTGRWVMRQHGDFSGCLTSYVELSNPVRLPTDAERAVAQAYIDKMTGRAAWYDYYKPHYQWVRLVSGEKTGGANTVFDVEGYSAEPEHDAAAFALLNLPQGYTIRKGAVTRGGNPVVDLAP